MLPVPKKHTSHMGHNPPLSPVLPNFNNLPTDYEPGDEGLPEWWEYLGLEDEDDYDNQMRNQQQMLAKERSNLNIYYTDDESSKYFGYSYDEIIAMYQDGVTIPDEVINWAMSMAQNDPVTNDTPVQSDDAEALYESLKQNPDTNLKTITKIFSDKCAENQETLDLYSEELTSLIKDATVIRNKIEILKEDSQKEIEPIKAEWEDLNYKLSHDIPLSENEKARAKYLQDRFGKINENYKAQISSEITNIGTYLEKISEISQKIEIANSYSRVSKTILDDLSNPEASSSSSGIITDSNIQTEETLSNDDITADFTNSLFNKIYELDTCITDVNYKTGNIQNIMEEMAKIGGFNLNDSTHTITVTGFADEIDFSLLDGNDTSNSASNENPNPTANDSSNPPTADDNSNPPPNDEGKGGNANGPDPKANNTPRGTNNQQYGTNTGGTSPEGTETGNRPNNRGYANSPQPTGETPNTPDPEGTSQNERNHEEQQVEDAENMMAQGDAMKKEGQSGISGVKSQTSDTRGQTKVTQSNGETSSSHKKDSIAKEKKVKKDFKNLEKAQKTYNKNLLKTQKQIETQQKKVDENGNRMDELLSKAETLNDIITGGDEDEDTDIVKEELIGITQEMTGIASETKVQSENLNKSIKTQTTLRKKAIDNSQKMEKSFGNMQKLGENYQGTNDKIQNAVEIIGDIASTVTTIGTETIAFGKGLQVFGTTEKATGQTLLSTIFTAALGSALTSAGIATDVAGKTMETVGTVAVYVGMGCSAINEATDLFAQDARKAEDSFVDTSESAKASGEGITKDIKSTEKDIKAMTKDTQAMKKEAAKFQAMAMQVANMGGAGGMSRVQGGGGAEGAASADGATPIQGGVAGNGAKNNATLVATNNTAGFDSRGVGIFGNENTEQPEGTTPLNTTEGANGNENLDEEIPNGENQTDFPDIEDLTVEVNLDEEENPEFAYNPEGAKDYGNHNSRYSQSKKPYIKAPESAFNQSPNNRKKR